MLHCVTDKAGSQGISMLHRGNFWYWWEFLQFYLAACYLLEWYSMEIYQ